MERTGRVDVDGLNEACRLMTVAAGLGRNLRRELERKSAATFWRAVGAGAVVEGRRPPLP